MHVDLSTHGASVSRRFEPVTVNSRGHVRVRLCEGLSRRNAVKKAPRYRRRGRRAVEFAALCPNCQDAIRGAEQAQDWRRLSRYATGLTWPALCQPCHDVTGMLAGEEDDSVLFRDQTLRSGTVRFFARDDPDWPYRGFVKTPGPLGGYARVPVKQGGDRMPKWNSETHEWV